MRGRLGVVRFVVVAVVAGALLPSPAAAQGAEAEEMPAECRSPLPQVLNLAMPYAPDVELATVERYVSNLLGRFYVATARCPNRPLQVNLALGNDYQIFEWLSHDAVDAALVPTLSLYLLRRDGVDLLEVVGLPGKDAPELELPGRLPRVLSFDLADGDALPRPAPEADLECLRQDLLGSARGPRSARSARHDRSGPSPGCEGGDLGAGSPLTYRIALTSHLSTSGFLVPVADTARWLDERLVHDDVAASDRAAIAERFWDGFFEQACFRFEGLSPYPASVGEERLDPCRSPSASGPTVEIRFAAAPTALRPEVPLDEYQPPLDFATPVRDHLVLRRQSTSVVLTTEAFRQPFVRLPTPAAGLFGGPDPDGLAALSVPAPFRPFLRPAPYFGSRTYPFSVDESLRLIALHQESTGTSSLALVLPGGGVKAAYQSRIIDALYGEGRLINRWVEEPPAVPARDGTTGESGDPPRALAVDAVIGTSGGALLGFFVARLVPGLGGDLSRLLWMKPANGGGGDDGMRFVDSADIFGWSDLPRYLSLVLILGVFLGVLGVVSLRRRGWLAPAGDGEGRLTILRVRLVAVLALVLAGTPLLVRWANGAASLEHVPELEGLLYAVCIGLAMFADQCLIVTRPVAGGDGRPLPTTDAAEVWLPPRLLLALGALLALLPTAAASIPRLAGALERPVSFAWAYLALGVTGGALVLVSLRRSAAAGRPALGWLAGVAGFAGATAVALIVLRLAGETLLAVLDGIPLIFLALVGIPLAIGLSRLIRAMQQAKPGWIRRSSDWLGQRTARLIAHPVARRAAPWASLLVIALAILDMTRPPAERFVAAGWSALAREPSKLDTPLGGLLVCLGALLVLLGAIRWLHASSRSYRLLDIGKFVDAVVFVILGVAGLVYLILAAGSELAPGRLTLFELTPVFWLALVLTSFAVSVAVVVWARWGVRTPPTERLRAALVYLAGHHPNAHLVSRRFIRLGLVAIGGLLWWNFVLAPGLYGNRHARDYFFQAAERFDASIAADVAAGRGRARDPYTLTASLLSPANALETDGTRFVLVVPGNAPCPSIQQPPGSGATWYRFHAIGAAGHAESDEDDDCVDLDLAPPERPDLDLLRSFVFASGSPFPIFPAHRVRATKAQAPEALVDGGYSNNVPIEAAERVAARQVLIVNSSNPLPGGGLAAGRRWLPRFYGPLVADTLRIPGFLYQRSQQLDRRSRANLFVVSLSPPYRRDWPLLTDFRSSVVERMIASADRDLGRRIGLVESWGPPAFQTGVRIEAPEPAAATRGRDAVR